MKKKSILRVTALIAALLMLCACQKAVPAGGEAENTSESTTADTREPVSVNILAVGDQSNPRRNIQSGARPLDNRRL